MIKIQEVNVGTPEVHIKFTSCDERLPEVDDAWYVVVCADLFQIALWSKDTSHKTSGSVSEWRDEMNCPLSGVTHWASWPDVEGISRESSS